MNDLGIELAGCMPPSKTICGRGVIAQLKFFDDGGMEPPLLQVSQSDILTLFRLVQCPAEKFLGKCIQDIKAFCRLLLKF